MNRPRRSSLALLGVLALTLAIYWPGLTGAFLLDDQANLGKLSKLGAPLTLDQLLAFSFSASGGPLGRPLSMLSFALQFESWPGDPQAFKAINILLHLVNGVLVFWFTTLLARAANLTHVTRMTAVIVAAAWLLHPIQVSTTLYVIQRMTLLATLFTLAGLIAFLYGRNLAAEGKARKGYWIASAGIGLGTILAIASKENGALLPLYALILEATLLTGSAPHRGWARWKAVFLYAPLIATAVALAVHFDWSALYRGRDFTLEERVLTEPRIVFDYLRKLFLVPPYNFGVFFDDYPLSRGLSSPPTAWLSIATIAALAVTALIGRKKVPVLAFAILWFLGAHVLESTFIPLELYFEHRNYLAVLGPISGMAISGSQAIATARRSARPIYLALFGTLLLAMALITWQQTRLWGNSLLQAAVWAKERPASPRSIEWAGTMFAQSGYGERASQFYQKLDELSPEKADGPMFQLYLSCRDPKIPRPDENTLARRLSVSHKSSGVINVLGELVRQKEAGECQALSDANLHTLLDAASANPAFKSDVPVLLVLEGRLYANAHDLAGAIGALNRAYSLAPRKEIAFQQFLWALDAGQAGLAQAYAEKTLRSTTGNRAHDRLINDQVRQLSRQ